MYLLQNSIIYRDSKRVVHEITTEEILSLEDKELREKIRTSRVVFFGGLAFSGYNKKFNANFGIYRDTIDRTTEIEESKKFEEIYNKVCSFCSDKNLVVFTHMPMDCWSERVDYHYIFSTIELSILIRSYFIYSIFIICKVIIFIFYIKPLHM